MALNAYMTVESKNQGKIEGSVDQAGREGTIEIFDIKHGMLAVLDSGGLPTSGRQHKPLTVTKPIDKATPLLQTLLQGDDMITKLVIELYRPSRTGAEVNFYTIELENASMVSFHLDMANNRYEGAIELPVMERISFTYDRIISTFTDGGIKAELDWESGR